MFDIAWSELLIVGAVALVIIGPKDLPAALGTLGKWMRKARLLTRDFQSSIDEMVRQAELEELREQARKVSSLNVRDQLEKMIDGEGTIRNALADTSPSPAVEPAAASEPVLPPPSGPGIGPETPALPPELLSAPSEAPPLPPVLAELPPEAPAEPAPGAAAEPAPKKKAARKKPKTDSAEPGRADGNTGVAG